MTIEERTAVVELAEVCKEIIRLLMPDTPDWSARTQRLNAAYAKCVTSKDRLTAPKLKSTTKGNS